MPHYRATHHAVERLLERFPVLAPVAGHGLAAARWLARLAERTAVVAQQSGMDLLLAVELPLPGGPARLYLPVTPHTGDVWCIRTVLTEAQALANLTSRADEQRAAWRARKGFTRPWTRRRASVRLTEAA